MCFHLGVEQIIIYSFLYFASPPHTVSGLRNSVNSKIKVPFLKSKTPDVLKSSYQIATFLYSLVHCIRENHISDWMRLNLAVET